MKMLNFFSIERFLIYSAKPVVHKAILSLFLTFVFGFKGFCQNVQFNSTLERFRKALVASDIKTLDDITSEQLTYGHSNGLIEDKKQFIEAIRNGTSKFTALNFTDQQISTEDNVFIVRNTWNCKTHNKGAPPNEFNLSVLTIWKIDKMNNIVLIARQAIRL